MKKLGILILLLLISTPLQGTFSFWGLLCNSCCCCLKKPYRQWHQELQEHCFMQYLEDKDFDKAFMLMKNGVVTRDKLTTLFRHYSGLYEGIPILAALLGLSPLDGRYGVGPKANPVIQKCFAEVKLFWEDGIFKSNTLLQIKDEYNKEERDRVSINKTAIQCTLFAGMWKTIRSQNAATFIDFYSALHQLNLVTDFERCVIYPDEQETYQKFKKTFLQTISFKQVMQRQIYGGKRKHEY